MEYYEIATITGYIHCDPNGLVVTRHNWCYWENTRLLLQQSPTGECVKIGAMAILLCPGLLPRQTTCTHTQMLCPTGEWSTFALDANRGYSDSVICIYIYSYTYFKDIDMKM